MFKIEKLAEGNTTVLRLVGRISAKHLDELNKLIADAEPRVVKLDLSEVTLVDVDVVRFLGDQERRGVELVKCSRYIREWRCQRSKFRSKNSASLPQNPLQRLCERLTEILASHAHSWCTVCREPLPYRINMERQPIMYGTIKVTPASLADQNRQSRTH